MYLTSEMIGGLRDRLLSDAAGFAPELILFAGLVLLLFLRLFTGMRRVHMGAVALCITLVALAASMAQWQSPGAVDLFSRMLVYDNLTIYLRMFLCAFAALVIWLSLLTRIPDREDSADFYCLLMGATVGMCIMASANHLLMVYIGVEMASLPSYALAGFLKGRRQSSEASLKYVVYGGGASGVMLYGISLLAGKYGTGYLPDLAHVYGTPHLIGVTGVDPILFLGTMFLLVGLAFKLAAVPFHFWCPDVFEGASAEVAAFLSVASKGAALALLGRLTLIITGLAGETIDYAKWHAVAGYLAPALAFFAALTATFGNLAAYPQTNLKRLLAYSTIAHAGYMMMGLATLTREGVAAVLFYLVAYLFMNLGAFAVVAFIRNQTGSEDLATYRGMVVRAPLLTVVMGIFLLSLLGMPPLAGFAAKFQIFSVLFDAGRMYSAEGNTGLGAIMYGLLVIGGLNTAISAVYYIRVLKVMAVDRPSQAEEEMPPLSLPAGTGFYAALMAALVILVGVAWNPLSQAANAGVKQFQVTPHPTEIARGS